MKKVSLITLGLIVATLAGGFLFGYANKGLAGGLLLPGANPDWLGQFLSAPEESSVLVVSDYNAVNEFGVTQGGSSGVWNYGYTANGASNTFIPFPTSETINACGGGTTLQNWTGGPSQLAHNVTGSTFVCGGIRIPADVLYQHPGTGGERTVLRWTAPAGGTYLVNGVWEGLDNTSTDAKILKNATEPALFSGAITGNTNQQPFSFTVTVVNGDTIDFSLGGNGAFPFDATGLAVTIGQPVTACLAPPANLQVFVPGENSPSDLQSGNTNASLVGDANYTTGKVGRGFTFDGTGDYVRIEDNAAQRPANALTLEGWFKFNGAPGIVSLISKPLRNTALNSYGMYFDGSTLRGLVGNAAQFTRANSNFTPQTGVWHHLAFTYVHDGITSTLKLYANGVEVTSSVDGTANLLPTYDANPYPILIGGEYENNAPGFFLNGQADEVSIYGRALTQPELFNITKQGSFGKCAPTNCVQPPSNLVSWYQGETNALDSRSNNHGTINGATFAAGKVGQAFNFNGTAGNFVSAGTSLGNFGTSDFTIDMWVQTTSARLESIISKRACTFSEPGYFDIRRRPNGAILFEVSNNGLGATGTVESIANISNGAFHHIAVRRQGGTLSIYIDGVLDNSTTGNPIININNANLFAIGGLGCAGIDATANFTGTIDEVSVYNKALSATEISSINAAGQNGKCAPVGINPTANQIAWYTGDGDTRDFLGLIPNGTAVGTIYAVGKVGQAFRFDGVNDYVSVPDAASLKPANVTVDAWIKFNSLDSTTAGGAPAGFQYIVMKHNSRSVGSGMEEGYSLVKFRDTGGDKFIFSLSSSAGAQAGAVSTTTIQVGQFYHVAGTYDGSNARIYVNGVLENTVATNIVLNYDNSPLFLGSSQIPFNGYFSGIMDETDIFDRALSASEVAAIYNAGVAGKLKSKPTATGGNVTTQLSDATVTFANVTTAGTTSQNGIDLGFLPPIPTGSAFTGLAYDISTTAAHQNGSADDVRVCFNLPALSAIPLADLRILHLENGAWINRTASGNTLSNFCSDNLTSISPFAIVDGFIQVNTAPVIDSIAPTTATEDILYTYNATRNDADGPGQSWSLLGTHTCGGSIVAGTGVFTFTPAGPVPPASCVVAVQFCDTGSPNLCATQSTTVTITATNDAPVINSTASTTATEDILYTYNATRNDPDGPGQAWSLLGSHTCGGSIGAGTGVFTFTAAGPVPVASCVVAVQVCDTGSPDLCATQSTTVTITAVNDSPAINGTAPTTATEDILYTYNATRNDPDGPGQAWSLLGSNTCGGSIVAGTGVFTFTPTGPTPPASCVAAVQVCDTGSPDLCATQSTTVTITATNDAPVINSTAPTTATEDILYTYNATRNDPDGPGQAWSLLGSHTCGGSIGAGTGVFTFTPAGPVPVASCVVAVQVCDTGSPNLCADQSTTVTISAVNDAPLNTVPGAQTVVEDSTLILTGPTQISIADADAGAAMVQVKLTGTNGTITLGGTTGLSFTVGDGTADATMTFTGTIANINIALNGLAFTPTPNYFGAASLAIETNDLGNTGSGGAKIDTDTVNITVATQSDLAVSKTDSPATTVIAGENITYTINLQNNGPSDAQSVTVTDAIPANTTFVSSAVTSGTGWTVANPSVGGTGNVVFSKATVAAGETAVFTVVVKVNAGAASASTITNNAVAASGTTDPTPGNNTGTATTLVATSANLSLTKTDSPDPVTAGQNITYTITVGNAGPSNAAAVSFSDVLSAGTTFVSLSSAAGYSCTTPAVGAGGTVSCSVASQAPGNAVFTLTTRVAASVAAGTVISNTATASSSTADPAPGNESGTATTTVAASADLSVTKTDSADPVNAGANLTYTITLTNNGASDAQGLSLSDTLAANTAFVSFTSPAGWAATTPVVGGTGTVTATRATMAASTNAVFSLVVNVNANTPHLTVITNSGGATSTTPDPNNANNTGTATTTVNSDTPPTAAAAAANVTTGGAASYSFTVTYTDDNAINIATLDGNDVSVTGPGGFNAAAAFVGVTPAGNGTPRVATYSIVPPGGTWNLADNGVYSVVVQAGQVADSIGNFVATGNIGGFTVNITTVEISGNIQQNNSPFASTPLAGVTVTLTGSATLTTTTGANGDYTLSNVPNGGDYVVTPTLTGRVFEPISRSYSNLTANVTNANFLAYNSGSVPRNLRLVNAYPAQGQPAVMPVVLTSRGNEASVAFSLNYDFNPLSTPVVACGASAPGCGLTVNSLTPGVLGVTIVPTAPFAAGQREIATVTFQTFATTLPSTAVTFGAVPTNPGIRDSANNPLPFTTTDGLVVFSVGVEGDLAPRNTGDGVVLSNDVTLARMFVVGSLTPNPGFNEFQRADTAPSSTKGDGQLDATDIIQTRRYAVGIDASQSAGGMGTPPALAASSARPDSDMRTTANRTVRVMAKTAEPRSRVTVEVELAGQGNEVAASFTLNFDPSKLSNAQVALASGMPSGAALTTNDAGDGRLGVLVDSTGALLPSSAPGQIVTITFDVAADAPGAATRLTFEDTLARRGVSDTGGKSLATDYQDGTISISGPTATGVEISGRVLSPDGRSLRNASVTLTDSNGLARTAITGSFGHYRFEGVERGGAYTIGVSSKRYRFASLVVHIADSLTGVDLIGLE